MDSEGVPAPLRNSTWLRGLPVLSASDRSAVENENIVVDFCLLAVETAAASNTLVFFEAAEDLGKAAKGTPASIWRWPAMQSPSIQGVLSRGCIISIGLGRTGSAEAVWSFDECSRRHSRSVVLRRLAKV